MGAVIYSVISIAAVSCCLLFGIFKFKSTNKSQYKELIAGCGYILVSLTLILILRLNMVFEIINIKPGLQKPLYYLCFLIGLPGITHFKKMAETERLLKKDQK